MNNALQGKVAIVTGANQGLGLVIAKKYLEAGVSGLSICARGEILLDQATTELRNLAGREQIILGRVADVSQPAAVRDFVSHTNAELGHIDILVNNAGVYGPKGRIEDLDWTDWVHTIEINLMGSILMCRAVLPFFKAQGHGKIVQVSGGGATSPLPYISAYAVSKAAVIRFIETVAEETRQHNIDVNAFAPGALNTRMLDEILEVGPEKVGNVFYERAVQQKQDGGASLDRAAELAVFLASALSDGITGRLISAVWDPWSSLTAHRADLNTTDIYTLRRIVPADRGRKWDQK